MTRGRSGKLKNREEEEEDEKEDEEDKIKRRETKALRDDGRESDRE